MPTLVEHHIGNGRDFSTLIAWEAATDDTSLVATDELRRALVHDDQDWTWADIDLVIPTEWTDSTRYRHIDAAAGDKYNPISNTGVWIGHNNSGAFGIIGGSEHYWLITDCGTHRKLFGYPGSQFSVIETAGQYSRCWRVYAQMTDNDHSFGQWGECYRIGNDTEAINCIAVGGRYEPAPDGARKGFLTYSVGTSRCKLYNCVCYAIYEWLINTDSDGFYFYGGTGHIVENCYSFDNFAQGFDDNGATFASEDYNASSDATAAGPNSYINQSTAATFTNAAARDFTVLPGAPTANKGKNLSGIFLDDFAETLREDPWDMGAYNVAGGGPQNLTDVGDIASGEAWSDNTEAQAGPVSIEDAGEIPSEEAWSSDAAFSGGPATIGDAGAIPSEEAWSDDNTMVGDVPLSQTHYRFAKDIGDEGEQEWLAAEDASLRRNVGQKLRLRICMQNGPEPTVVAAAQLQRRLNGGAWGAVNGSSTVARIVDGQRPDGEDNTVKLLSGTGTFRGTRGYDDVDGQVGSASLPPSGHWEVEFTLELEGSLTAGDAIELRLLIPGAVYPVYPTLYYEDRDLTSALSVAGAQGRAKAKVFQYIQGAETQAGATGRAQITRRLIIQGPLEAFGSAVGRARIQDGAKQGFHAEAVGEAWAQVTFTLRQFIGGAEAEAGAWGRARMAEYSGTNRLPFHAFSRVDGDGWAKITLRIEEPPEPPEIIRYSGDSPVPLHLLYRRVLELYLPRGDIWRELLADEAFADLVQALAYEPARVAERVIDLMRESDLRFVTEMLVDWERFLRLPNECLRLAPPETLGDRRGAVISTLTRPRRSRASDLVEAARKIGIVVTVEEWTPDSSSVTVRAPETPIYWGDVNGTCTDPLRWWGVELLECVVKAAAPYHVNLVFVYDQ